MDDWNVYNLFNVCNVYIEYIVCNACKVCNVCNVCYLCQVCNLSNVRSVLHLNVKFKFKLDFYKLLLDMYFKNEIRIQIHIPNLLCI